LVGPGLFVPDEGDLIWLTFTPQAGFEQAGRRPALVLSPRSYNGRSGLCLVCPVTRSVKGYPFEVALPAVAPVQGVVLADHIRSVDYRARAAESIGPVGREVLGAVRDLIRLLVG
jgi:mRNA interferase MazF